MNSKIKNELGYITIDDDVISRIAGLAAMECCGIVGMGAKSVKDGFVHLLKRESLAKGIQLNLSENSVSIDIHIIVEYGTNITAVAESLIDAVKYKVEAFVGLNVEKVNVFIEGVRVDA